MANFCPENLRACPKTRKCGNSYVLKRRESPTKSLITAKETESVGTPANFLRGFGTSSKFIDSKNKIYFRKIEIKY
ncbi:hypothetical protein, partial [Leptospira alstonii]|uniref:hypothetical protein n=1 Tax=Leptospira alstonii TaxID=28452 RepID=UPI0005626FBF